MDNDQVNTINAVALATLPFFTSTPSPVNRYASPTPTRISPNTPLAPHTPLPPLSPPHLSGSIAVQMTPVNELKRHRLSPIAFTFPIPSSEDSMDLTSPSGNDGEIELHQLPKRPCVVMDLN